MQPYTTVKQAAEAEFVEKRSRFIGAVKPVQTEEEAAAFLAEIRAKHWDASHNCHAYVLRGNKQRYSDDGEPQGTAGIPILEILRKENVIDAVIVVTRYFGGTLLGAGGLVRAYSHTAKLAVETAGKLVMRPCIVLSLDVPYPLYDRVNLLLQGHGAVVLKSDFVQSVKLELRVPLADFGSFEHELTELTKGAVKPAKLGEEFA